MICLAESSDCPASLLLLYSLIESITHLRRRVASTLILSKLFARTRLSVPERKLSSSGKDC